MKKILFFVLVLCAFISCNQADDTAQIDAVKQRLFMSGEAGKEEEYSFEIEKIPAQEVVNKLVEEKKIRIDKFRQAQVAEPVAFLEKQLDSLQKTRDEVQGKTYYIVHALRVTARDSIITDYFVDDNNTVIGFTDTK
ncbi:hypothetical protein [Flavobacterium rhizosphaerae]|uniref:Lipoprotein n=1 Tax=Flavobacterium rhizosphaerae TaxID=3163298 RepID=A0ABW8Z0T4_9FLAO